ncbi:MAG: DUF3325 family protein [Sphingobium sp.]
MSLEVLALCYAGMTGIAVSTTRFRQKLVGPLPSGHPLKGLGVVLLLLALRRAMVLSGAAQGVVLWAGLLCVSGAALVLFSSRWPRMAAILAIPALLLSGPMILIG